LILVIPNSGGAPPSVLVGSCSAIGQEEPCAMQFTPVGIAVIINSTKRFRADQAGAEIVVDPAAPERDIAKLPRTDTHVPLDFAGRDSRFEGHRKREAPLQTAKGRAGGSNCVAASSIPDSAPTGRKS
jgi:hypothetical protein